MIFNKHSSILESGHAFLSPSKYHWINYDDDKMQQAYLNALVKQRGDQYHALAAELIRLGIQLPDVPKTINMYVNDAIGFRMVPEQMLYYSVYAYGTADAISFNEKTLVLRVSDLKTGETETSEKQLYVYVALFCLEYRYDPFVIAKRGKIELRIYQNNECRLYEGDPDIVMHIMDRIKTGTKMFQEIREEAL